MAKYKRTIGICLHYLLNYLLAGGFLVVTGILLVVLYEIIVVKGASYPYLPPTTSSSLAKPVFLQSVAVQMPGTFKGTALSVSPDGKRIAYWGGSKQTGDRGFFVGDMESGEEALIWRYVTWHAWSPDSTRLLLAARQEELGTGGIAIVSIDGGAFEWIVLPPDESAVNAPLPVTAATWDAGGKAVLMVQTRTNDRTNELWRLDLSSGQQQRLAALPKETDKRNIFVRSLSISPDGKKVSFITADRPGAEQSATWWVMNMDGSSPIALMKRSQDAGFVNDWRWLPDSRQLIFTVKLGTSPSFQPATLWRINADGTARRLVANSDNVQGFSLSPKGNWLIYGKEGHLWMASTDAGGEQQVTFGDDIESLPTWTVGGDVLYHQKVGRITSLQLLLHADPEDIPGLVAPVPVKGP